MWKKVGIMCILWFVFFMCMLIWWDINETYSKAISLMLDTHMAMKAALYQSQVADDYFTNSGIKGEGTYYGGLFTETSETGQTGGAEPFSYFWNYATNEFVERSLLRVALMDATANKQQLLNLYLGANYTSFKNDVKLNTGNTFTFTNFSGVQVNLLDEVGIGRTGYAGTYYYTPLALGVTYLNPDVFRAAFESNLQVLARTKFIVGTPGVSMTGVNLQMANGTGLIYKEDFLPGRSMDGAALDPNGTRWLNNGQYEIDLNSLQYTMRYYIADMSGGMVEIDDITTYLYGKTQAQLSGQDTGTSSEVTTTNFLVVEVTATMDAFIPYSNVLLRWYAAQSTNWFNVVGNTTEGEINEAESPMTELDNTTGDIDYVTTGRAMTDVRVARHGGIAIRDYTVRALFAVTR